MALTGMAWLTASRFSAAASWRRLRRAIIASPFSRLLQLPPPHDTLLIAPADLNTTDPVFAEDLLDGRFTFAGVVVQAGQANVFSLPPPNMAWRDALHGFQWLRHLVGLRDEAAQALTRRLIEQWMASSHGHWDAASWAPPILTQRIIAWLKASPVILTGSEAGFYRRFLHSLIRQVRYLDKLHPHLEPGLPQLSSAIVMAMVGLGVKRQRRLLMRANKALTHELRRQIDADGGHVSRNPSVTVELLSLLLPLQMLYTHRTQTVPSILPKTIERMLAYLRTMRHADGALATFNGATAMPQELVASILVHTEERHEPRTFALTGGYARLQCRDSVLIVDCGRTPPLQSRDSHAGALALEFSANRQRLIINCGAPHVARDRWAEAVRASAAHNVTVLADQSSARISPEGLILRPARVDVRHDHSEGQRLYLDHDGYVADFDAHYRRILILSDDGTHLSGVERILTTQSGLTVDCRFHLHPAVQLFQAEGLDGLMLSPPAGPEWIFRSTQPFEVQESVFVSGAEGPRKTMQIVIHGVTASDGWTADWSLLEDHRGSR